MFANVPKADPDPIFFLSANYKADTDPRKVNLGIGAYRTDEGKPWVLPAVKKAELQIVNNQKLDHEYLPIEGLDSFTTASAALILGHDHPSFTSGKFSAHQTISGTGAVRFAAEFLSRFTGKGKGTKAYMSKPTWGNHFNIFNDAGLPTDEYRYWDPSTNSLDLAGMLSDIQNAPDSSIIVLHACAHNPTGVDPTQEQWAQIADVIERKRHYIVFDSAYQGFASGDVERDAYAVRYFARRGLEFLVCQSYSKNFGLYNERCGCIVAVCKTAETAQNIKTQIAKITRPMISNPPAFGARIVDTVMNTPELYEEWIGNLKSMAGRIIEMRQKLYAALLAKNTPGQWNHIVDQIGMFSYTGLSRAQCKVLKEKFHVYLTDSGRISMAGLNTKNVEYFADAVDYVVRNVKDSSL